MVRNRRAIVRNGWAYVPDVEMITLISWIFKSHLNQALVFTNKILPNLDEDDRLLKVLGDLDRRYTGQDYGNKENDDVVTPGEILGLSEKSFPLCMQAMQITLNTTCLLYTSPSPRDRQKSRMPSSA